MAKNEGIFTLFKRGTASIIFLANEKHYYYHIREPCQHALPKEELRRLCPAGYSGCRPTKNPMLKLGRNTGQQYMPSQPRLSP